MRRLEIKNPEETKEAIMDEIARSEDSKYDHRLHGLLLICQGFSCYEVAKMLGHSPRTIQYWVRRFEKDGFAGLEEKERSGRPANLTEEMLEDVGKDLRLSPHEHGYTQNLWDGKLLSHHLKQKYGLDIGTRQCQRIFHRLGLRRRKPGGVIATADPQARETFKKDSKS